MTYFADKDGHPVYLITNENKSEFVEWLLSSNKPEAFIDRKPVRLADDIKLSDILPQDKDTHIKLNKSVAKQEYLAALLVNSCSETNVEEYIETLLNNTDKYPKLTSLIYSGASISSSKPYKLMYNEFLAQMEKRNILENLTIAHALFMNESGNFDVPLGKQENIRFLESEQAQKLEDIYKLAKSNRGVYSVAPMNYIQRLFERGDLLNYQAPAQMRDDINKYYFDASNNENSLSDRVLRMDNQFYTKDLVIRLLRSDNYRTIPFTEHDTSQAVSQEEKNVNIQPADYRKMKQILIEMSHETPAKKKGYNHHIQLLAIDLYNSGGREHKAILYKDIPEEFKKGIINDLYLLMARVDIMDGNADLLDRDALQLVMNTDRNNFYLKRVSPETIKRKKINLSARQKAIQNMETEKKHYVADDISRSSYFSYEEKLALIHDIEHAMADELGLKDVLQRQSYLYNKASTDVALEKNNVIKKYDTLVGIQALQVQFARLQKVLKPNATEETHLTKEEVEKVISSVLKGKRAQVKMPKEAPLPLLFSRKKEIERRKKRTYEIDELNHTLSVLEVSEELRSYIGHILDEESLTRAQDELREAKRTHEEKSSIMNSYDATNMANINQQLESIKSKEETVAQAKLRIIKEHIDLRTIAKENVGVPQESPLQAVSKEMSAEEKKKVRAQNRRVADKLKTKEESLKGKTEKSKLKTRQYKTRLSLIDKAKEHN